MFDRKEALHDLGRLVYGLAGIALGLIGLTWRDFAAVWQPIDNLGVGSHRTAVAIIFAAALLAAGAATLWRRTAPVGVLALAGLHSLAALGWVPRVINNGAFNGFFEQLALVAAGIVAYASLAPDSAAWKTRTARIGCLVFGVCAVSFAFGHFTAIKEAASFVPKWIPPGQLFWSWATGVFHLLAGIAILTGVMDVLASRLLTAMMIGFGALVWAPALVARPDSHFTWCGNAINLALVGAAWVVADAIRTRRRRTAVSPPAP